MTVRPKPGCQFWQAEFEYCGVRHHFSTRETTKAGALRKERQERRRIELEHASQEAVREAALAGRPAPEYASIAATGHFTAQRMAKDYWDTVGWQTENADALANQIEQMLSLVGRGTFMTTVDDFAMLRWKSAIKIRGPQNWSRKKGEYAPSSINDQLRLIFRIYNFARNVRHCPMVYQLNQSRWLDPEPVNTREMGIFEEMRLEAVCERRRPELIPVYRFGILTMVRREALCLTWQQVDWELRRITVALKGRGKEKKRHLVPLSPSALDILKAERGRHPTHVFSIVTRQDAFIRGKIVKAGSRVPLTPQYFGELMREMFDEAGLLDLTAGHLRHTGATRALRACGSLETVRLLLGHTTDKCTKRYAAMVSEDSENAVVLLDALQTAARRKALAALRDPTSEDVRDSVALFDAFDAKARAAARERLRKDALATTFAYATAG